MRLPFLKAKTFALCLISASLVLTSCASANNLDIATSSDQAASAEIAMVSDITVFRSPTCGCCGKWIEHAETAGFQVKDEITEDMDAIKQQYGIPQNLMSCHTTVIDNYVIEGHVPAEDVQKLLTEKPDIAGIAVPGMPIGSPGMESGDYVEPYAVLSFTKSGETAVFSEH